MFVKGAEPGDLLEIEFLDIAPQPTAFTAIFPGGGYLRDVMTEPFLVHWSMDGAWATSEQIPGVRIPGAPSWGSRQSHRRPKNSRSGLSASSACATGWTRASARSGQRDTRACGLPGLRTIPPRENGGNFDVKQLTKGARLFLPVFKQGALFSTGDAHFAQGDGEVCLTAVEMAATATVRFRVHKGAAAARNSSPSIRATRIFCRSKDRDAGQILGSWECRSQRKERSRQKI